MGRKTEKKRRKGCYRIERCPNRECRRQHQRAVEAEPVPCRNCGTMMRYMPGWYECVVAHGKKRQKKAGETITDAEKKRNIAVGRRDSGLSTDRPKDLSFREALAQFETYVENNCLADTKRMYIRGIRILEKERLWMMMTLRQIAVKDVEEWKRKRLATPVQRYKPKDGQRPSKKKDGRTLKPATVNRELATLKRLYSYMAETLTIQRDDHYHAIMKIEHIPGEVKRTAYLTEKQCEKLIANSHPEWCRMAIKTALNTGLRKEGVLTLRWQRIVLHGRNPSITAVLKGGEEVTIPIAPEFVPDMMDWKKKTGWSEWVFPSPRQGKHICVTGHKAFDAAFAAADLPGWRVHDLRHTFANHFLLRTRDLDTLQKILGHKSMKTTMRYVNALMGTVFMRMAEFKGIGTKKRRKNTDAATLKKRDKSGGET